MRQGLRKLASISIEERGGPELLKIDSATSTLICYSRGYRDVKVMLLEIYIKDNIDFNSVRQAILAVNDQISTSLLEKERKVLNGLRCYQDSHTTRKVRNKPNK